MPKAKKKMKVRDQRPAKDPKGGGHKHGHRHSNVSVSGDPADRPDRPVPFGHLPQ